MPISYDKLWKLLIDKKMNRTDLKDASGISFNVLAKMGKNEFVSMESLMKICALLVRAKTLFARKPEKCPIIPFVLDNIVEQIAEIE